MPHTKQLVLMLGDATRLLGDATLLVDHHRYASAFAVLGVEEIGKALIEEINKKGMAIPFSPGVSPS